jgi:uncharacterized integral membrane protein
VAFFTGALPAGIALVTAFLAGGLLTLVLGMSDGI